MQQLANTESMPIFKRLEQVAEYHQLSPEDRMAYDISYKHWLDAYNFELARRKGLEDACAKSMAEGIEKGRTEGMAEGIAIGKVEGIEIGIEKGEQKKQRAIAKTMKELGVVIATIAQGTGLSEAEVEAL